MSSLNQTLLGYFFPSLFCSATLLAGEPIPAYPWSNPALMFLEETPKPCLMVDAAKLAEKQFPVAWLAVGDRSMIDGCKLDGCKLTDCLKFISWKKEPLDRGRKWLTRLASYCRQYDRTENQPEDIREFRRYHPSEPVPNDLSLRKVGFKVVFWTAELERPLAPNLAQVEFDGERIRYYSTDSPDLRPHLVFEEKVP